MRTSIAAALVASSLALVALPRGARATPLGPLFYHASYVNLTLAAESARGPVALVAGSHDQDFPYFGTRPWDNGLLLFAGHGYAFTQRTQGVALHVERGRVRYDGAMKRVSDGKLVRARLDLPLRETSFAAFPLGLPGFGMLWKPSELDLAGQGFVAIDATAAHVTGGHGQLERGLLAMPDASTFAIAYDYVSVAAPGPGGYAFVEFTPKPLALAGTPLDPKRLEDLLAVPPLGWTLDGGRLLPGNLRRVARPTALFETEVDLGLAMLRRQMVETKDGRGTTLYGLREIFTRK